MKITYLVQEMHHIKLDIEQFKELLNRGKLLIEHIN